MSKRIRPSPAGGASRDASLAEVFGSIKTRPTGPMWRKLLAFLGPGYLVAVGYMDPGNWATSLAGGSKFGYALLFIALLSNIMAIILQALCARLGVASGRDLAQACRDAFPRWVSYPLWALAELAICATDLAEVIGTAIGLNLLFGIPLEIGVILTALDVFLILWMQKLGFRYIEAFIVAMLGVIAVCFGIQIAMADPDWGQVIRGFAPTVEIVKNPEMLYLALGIIGATVMPHNLYLHSGVVQTRAYGRSVPERREAIKLATIDSTIALMFALTINASILILAASTFHQTGQTDVTELEEVHSFLVAAARLGLRADAVRHRAACLRAELHGDGDAVGADRDGGLPRYPAAALSAAAGHPRHRHRARGHRHHLVRVGGHGAAPDPVPGGAQPAAALRHRAAGDVHRRQAQDGRAGRAALADGARRRSPRHRHHAEPQAALGFRRSPRSRPRFALPRGFARATICG